MSFQDVRLVEETYPCVIAVSSRFSDVIRDGHLNNAILATYYEEGRRSLERALFAGRAWPEGPFPVVVQTQARFLAAGSYPGDLHVGCGVAKIGTSSFHVAQGLFQGSRCLGLCDTVMVHLGENGRATSLTALYRSVLEPYRLRESSAPIV
jgi:acyl-CoA thioester hydrolase